MEQAYNDENLEVVNVPHTWNALDGANVSIIIKAPVGTEKKLRFLLLLKGS